MDNNPYKNGKIYVICNCIDDEIYVGSTRRTLHKRFIEHKKDCKSGKSNMKIYHHMKTLGVHNFYIELHEEYPCNNRRELTRREGQIIRLLKSSLNVFIAGRTRQEWKTKNKDILKKKRKNYRAKNKDIIKKKNKEYKAEYYQRKNEFYGSNRNKKNFKKRMKNWKPKLEIHLQKKRNLSNVKHKLKNP